MMPDATGTARALDATPDTPATLDTAFESFTPLTLHKYRLTLTEQYSDRSLTLIATGVSADMAAATTMRTRPGWTVNHRLTVEITDLSDAEQQVADLRVALLTAQTHAAATEAQALSAHRAIDQTVQAAHTVAGQTEDRLKAAEVYLAEVRARPATTPAGTSVRYPTPPPGSPLRTNGPAFEEFVRAGYSPAAYPPYGYAAVESPGWQAEQTRRELQGSTEASAESPAYLPPAPPVPGMQASADEDSESSR